MADPAGPEQKHAEQHTPAKTADDVQHATSQGDRGTASQILFDNVLDIQKNGDKHGFLGSVRGVFEMAELNSELHSRHLLPGVDLIGVDPNAKHPTFIVRDGTGVHDEDVARMKLDLSPNDATPRQHADAAASAYHAKVRVENKDGVDTYTFYTVDSNNKPHDILKSTDMNNVTRELEEARQKKIADVQTRFGVKIITDGSDKTHPPNFAELASVEKALTQSEPAQITHDGNPMEIRFHDEGEGVANRSSDGKTSKLNIYPDAEKADLAGVLRHEIAHNGDDETHKGDSGKQQQQALYESIGYTKLDNGEYVIRAKDGATYKQLNKDESFSDWTRVNADGKTVDANGKEVPADQAAKFTNDEMRENAQVRPPSDYFPHPQELQADAFRAYRGGPVEREKLYKESPTLYEITAREDQRQINIYYPPNPDGSPSYVRLPSGELSRARVTVV
jgi:hypothetical protein